MNVNEEPAESVLKEILVDEVLSPVISQIGISESPLSLDFGELWLPCSILTGKSCGLSSISISSARTFGTSCNSRVCSSGV